MLKKKPSLSKTQFAKVLTFTNAFRMSCKLAIIIIILSKNHNPLPQLTTETEVRIKNKNLGNKNLAFYVLPKLESLNSCDRNLFLVVTLLIPRADEDDSISFTFCDQNIIKLSCSTSSVFTPDTFTFPTFSTLEKPKCSSFRKYSSPT